MISVTKKTTPAVNFPTGLLEISVCDTGPGISRSELAHIFDRFYQADSTYEKHPQGSGIGLALAKGGTVPPFLGAWLSNIVFGGIGIYFINRY